MSLARGVAVLMIVNSHLEEFYPWPWLADGGLIGLAIFFLCSGLGLGLSPRTRQSHLGPWYRRRLLRIYPSLLVTVLAFQVLLDGKWREWQSIDYVRTMVYPTDYHFITKILVYYFAVYFYVRSTWRWKHLAILGGISIFCFAVGIPDMLHLSESGAALRSGRLSPWFLWSVFLLMTLMGVWIADRTDRFTAPLRHQDFLLFGTLFVAYLVTKFTFVKLGRFSELFVVLFAISIAFSYQLLRILCHPDVTSATRKRTACWWALAGLGAISLEMYVVHARMLHWDVWQLMSFPLNIVSFFTASVVASLVVYRAAMAFRSMVETGRTTKT